MNRSAFAPAVALLFSAAISTAALAQAQPAAPTTPSAAQKAKFAMPLKGDATIQVIQGDSKFVGKEIVTVYKIKNLSKAPIAMLKLEEYWYDKGGKLVTMDTQRHKQPFQPDEVIELTTHAPGVATAARKQATFSHANGKVVAKGVKKFD
jgi:hypothetical protein